MCSIIKFLYLLLNKSIVFMQFVLFEKIHDSSDIKVVMILRNGSIGDSICSLPSINDIKLNFPNARLILLVNSNNNISLKNIVHPDLFDEILDYKDLNLKQLVLKIKSFNIDLFVDLSQDLASYRVQLRNLLFVRYLGIRHGFGWSVSTIKFAKRIQAKCISFENEIDRLSSVLKFNNVEISNNKEFPINLNINRRKILNVMGESRFHKMIIVIAVGANRKSNRWPIENFKELTSLILFNYPESRVILVGGSDDRALSNKIDIRSNQLINCCGKLNINETMHLIGKSRLCICNDSGLMHVSYAVKTPVIALISSWQYEGKWHPMPNYSKVIRKNVSCSLCYKWDCKDNICMSSITPVEVFHLIKDEI